MNDLLINDGYVAIKTIPPVPGLYPELVVTYRPALSRERHAYRAKNSANDATVIDTCETDLICRYCQDINGQTLRDKSIVAKLKPAIRALLVDLILGYTPEDERGTAENLQ